MPSPLTRLAIVAIAIFLPVFAQAVAFTDSYYTSITADTPFVLTWSGDNTAVDIALLNGDPANLQVVSSIVAGATGTSFTWTPPQVTTSGLYALSITQSGAVNYSPQFTINSASQTTTSLTTVTSATSTSTNIIFSTAITPSAIVASSLIPSNATALPSVTNVPPYPTVNQNSTFTGPTGTVISASVYAYPSTTGAGNFSGAGLPSRFTGTAVRARSQVGIAAAVLLGALTWAVVMG